MSLQRFHFEHEERNGCSLVDYCGVFDGPFVVVADCTADVPFGSPSYDLLLDGISYATA